MRTVPTSSLSCHLVWCVTFSVTGAGRLTFGENSANIIFVLSSGVVCDFLGYRCCHLVRTVPTSSLSCLVWCVTFSVTGAGRLTFGENSANIIFVLSSGVVCDFLGYRCWKVDIW